MVAPRGGACMVARGGMCGCSRWVACVVAPGVVWLLQGVYGCSQEGRAWLLRGACVVAPGGVCGCSGWGACMVAPGGAWLLPGGVHGCSGGGHAWDTMRYRDTINERAVRILLECILVLNILSVS